MKYTQYAHTGGTSLGTVSSVGNLTSSDTLEADAVANPLGVVGATITAKSQVANGADTALVAGTHNLMPADGNACTLTLPAAASSEKGDVIILEWQAAVNNGETQKVGTAGEFYMAGSAIYKRAAVEIFSVDVANGSSDDFANFIGLSNAGPGIGSYAVISYNGSKWRMEARLTSSGNGSAANASAFATT